MPRVQPNPTHRWSLQEAAEIVCSSVQGSLLRKMPRSRPKLPLENTVWGHEAGWSLSPINSLLLQAFWFPTENSYMRVFISYGCYDTLPQTGWLNTTGIHSVSVLGTRCLKSRGQQGLLPPKGNSLGENPSCLFQLPVASGFPWRVATSLQSLWSQTPTLTRVCVKPLPLMRILAMACKSLIIQGNLFISKSLI